MTGFSGQVCNFGHDISSIVEDIASHPRRVEDLPLNVVSHQQPGVAVGEVRYHEFCLRKERVGQHLAFYMEHNQHYRRFQVSQNVLDEFPEDGFVNNRMHTLFFDNQTSDSDDDEDSEQNLGPNQGGATGMPRSEIGVREEYMPAPHDTGESLKQQIICTVQNAGRGTIQNPNCSLSCHWSEGQ